MNFNKNNSSKLHKSSLMNLLTEKSAKNPALVPPVLQQVGRLAVGVANVHPPINSGSATGNPRNKCALRPGHSLMDWIRLGSSGKDLTGVGPNAGRLSVTKEELANHSKWNDAWLAIRGKVYNITEYLPFHPGGEEELMRGAGKDATSLFDQVHPWVNYEQILNKCLVGRLVAATVSADLFVSEKSDLAKNLPPSQSQITDTKKSQNVQKNERKPSILLPRLDWIQKTEYISIIFYTRALSNPAVEVSAPTSLSDQEKQFNNTVIQLIYDGVVYVNEISFKDRIEWPCSVKVTGETGKIEITFKKATGAVWNNYGSLTQKSREFKTENEPNCFHYFLARKRQVNHNIYLLDLQREDQSVFVIPLGKHLRVFEENAGQTQSRSYTPVPETLFNQITVRSYDSLSNCTVLMVKRYENGNLSRTLTDKKIGDVIFMSRPLGDFDLKEIEKRETFLILAAGTGITPMFSLIVFLLERRIKKCQFVRLLFYNKTESDIPFKEQLEKLKEKDPRLKVNHILSEPTEAWGGHKGHVNRKTIEDALQEHIKDTGYTIKDIFALICGPRGFLEASRVVLQGIALNDDQMHIFDG